MRLDMLVYGIFNTRSAFVTAVNRLKAEGFLGSQIFIALSPFAGEKDFVAMIDKLMSQGMPEYEALHYARLILDGYMFVSIHSGIDQRDDQAIEILHECGAREISSASIEKKSRFTISANHDSNKIRF